jgi:transcriptional regulator with XRE-family HTH domain
MDATPIRCATCYHRVEHFGALVQQARKQVGLTQGALAGRAGVHRSTIVRWEGGAAIPSHPDAFRAVCEALGIDPREAAVALGYLTPDEPRQAA